MKTTQLTTARGGWVRTTRYRAISAKQGLERRTPQAAKATGNRPFAGGVCTSITAPSVEEARRRVRQAKDAKADLIEFRLDYLQQFNPGDELGSLLEASSDMPYIVTYRPSWEGGLYEGKESERLAVLREAVALGAPFVDVELKAAEAFFGQGSQLEGSSEIILSHHDYDSTPSLDELELLMTQMRDAGADIAKIATTPRDITDCGRLLALLKQQTDPAIVLGMGERGLMTRILAPKYGGFLTFGALSSGQESAPGQPTLHSLREIYRIQNVKSSTKVFGVIGNPIAHSKSPHFHNSCFQAAGLDAVFLPLLVDDFELFIETFTDPDFAGYCVTMPHKEAALRAASEVDTVAKGIGAANTLVHLPNGTFRGLNTDCFAAMDIIEAALKLEDEKSSLEGKTMVVIGAGGVSKALAYGGVARGAQVMIANRTLEKAQSLAKNIPQCTVVSMEALQNGEVEAEVLANGTSLGMEPHEDTSAVSQAALGNFKLVFDAVYSPRETKLLREAAEVGCKTASGFGMFVGQAKLQFEAFTGQAVPPEALKRFMD